MKPQVFFGLHMVEGVAEYRDPGKDPYRILVGENAIKRMDNSFQGQPVYVQHVEEVEINTQDAKDSIIRDADGYVIRSFFNKSDGKHWAEFIVTTQQGIEAIRSKKWKLSNAYQPQEFSGGGLWHGVTYEKELQNAEYDHLAIVPNPRYSESVILTPEEFRSYNEKKESDLKQLANQLSKEPTKMKLSFFKKAPVENAIDVESMSVALPKSKKEVTLSKLINDADEMEMNMDKPQMCNGEHRVKVGDEEMSVNELVDKHMAMKSAMDKPEGVDEMDKKEMDNGADKDMEENAADMKLKEEKESEVKEAKKQNELAEAAKKKANFDKLKNAQKNANEAVKVIETSIEKVTRGKQRYGSK